MARPPSSLRLLLYSEQVELHCATGSNAMVLGDAIRLEQVLLNLLKNALDAKADAE